MDHKTLADIAVKAKERSMPTYSKFRVGSALLTNDGKVFTGGNIESSSFSLTICAERVALFKALSEGERNFTAIAIASDDNDYCPPCGACRQVLNDFCGNIEVILMNHSNELKIFRLGDLLPHPFGDVNLK
jgi:cytidine deaminase